MIKTFRLNNLKYKVDINQDGCHLLIDYTNKIKNGYALVGKNYLHRLIYEDYYEDFLPKGAYLYHTCGEKLCMNPEHMQRGTREGSYNAYKRKSRYNLLKEDQVRAIRKDMSSTLSKLAKEFDVSTGTISAIRRGVTWKHLR